MVEKRYVPKKGFEDFYELAVVKKEQFDSELVLAKEKAIEEVEREFSNKKIAIEEIFEKVADVIEVDIADEIIQSVNIDEIEESQEY